MGIQLTVVDQSPVLRGENAAEDALSDSIDLAKKCEAWGYNRYWFAEHHNSKNFAGPAPEILVAAVAALTSRIRVGTGGVMLPHYSPFKVAEQFQSLERLFPNRIDLGVGRAPGGDGLASHALSYPKAQLSSDTYAEQAQMLFSFLRDTFEHDHPYRALNATQGKPCSPELWMLGSSGGSAALAGQLGYKMALALFIGPEERPLSIFEEYKQSWRDSKQPGDPEAMVAISAVCADSDEEAKALAGPQSYWKTRAFRQGIREPICLPQEVPDLVSKMSLSDQSYFQTTLDSVIHGSPSSCKEQLHRLSQHWGCAEVAVVTITHNKRSRERSYELLIKD